MKTQLPIETVDRVVEAIRRVEVYAELIASAACSEVACPEAIADGARSIGEETRRLRLVLGLRRKA